MAIKKIKEELLKDFKIKAEETEQPSLSGSRENRIKSIVEKLNKKFKGVSFVDELLEKEKSVKRIPLSLPSLHKILGGGLPLGRVIEVFGQESSGKSTLALQIIADAQKVGIQTLLVDTERCYMPAYGTALEVDNSKMILANPIYGEDAFEIIKSLIEEGGIKLIVIDSVAAMIPREDSSSDALGSQARMMSKYLRKIIPILADYETSLIFINQVRKNISTSWGVAPSETTTGGMALKFFSSVRIEIKKIKTIYNQENEVVGSEIALKTVKDKMNNPFKKIVLNLYNGKGFSKIIDLIKIAEKSGTIVKVGSWFKFQNKSIAQGYEQLKTLLEDDKKVLGDLLQSTLEDTSNIF